MKANEPMPAITLRPAEPADQPFLLALYASTRDDLAAIPANEATRQQLLRMQYDAQQLHYRTQFPLAEINLVLVDGQPAGRLYVDRGAVGIRLIDISLLPAFQRQGVGRQLLQTLQAQAARSGLPLRLSVLAGNPAARLYQRLGFHASGAPEGVHQPMEWHAGQAGQVNDMSDTTS